VNHHFLYEFAFPLLTYGTNRFPIREKLGRV